MLTAVESRGTHPRFYEVNYNLAVASLDWLEDVCCGDVVVLIDYFGFAADSACAAPAKEQGAWILEDKCQALLSESTDQFSDFVLFSPRKYLGVPDGGILSMRSREAMDDIKLGIAPADWWLKALRTVILRRESDMHGGNRSWFRLYQETESQSPIGAYAMSELSKILLMHCIDYRGIASRRIANYRELARVLSAVALFPKLPPGVVPLGFPIRVAKRDALRKALFEQQIYPPVHWPIEGLVPDSYQDSHRLAKSIMTLPCDQRYGTQDMQRMADLVWSGLRK
jgi:dTDP-4-amino-4,6-dideoxygalactose transaminase